VERHPFDPVSAVLGVLAAVAGILVTVGADVDTDGPWWLAAAAVLVGLAVIPWRRRSSSPPPAVPVDDA
jgi:drug/metabolite transporter (DMT)-like permease